MFAGIGKYMAKGLAAPAPSTMEIKEVAPPERKDSREDSTLITQLQNIGQGIMIDTDQRDSYLGDEVQKSQNGIYYVTDDSATFRQSGFTVREGRYPLQRQATTEKFKHNQPIAIQIPGRSILNILTTLNMA